MSPFKKAFLLFCCGMIMVSFSACKKEGAAERAGRTIDESAEKAGEKIKNSTEKAGDTIEQAGKKVKESVKQ